MLKRYREFRESVKSKFGELIDFPPTSKYYTSGKDRDKWIKEIDSIVTFLLTTPFFLEKQ